MNFYSLRVGSEKLFNGYTRIYDAPKIVEGYDQWLDMVKDAHNQSIRHGYVEVQLWSGEFCAGRYTAQRS